MSPQRPERVPPLTLPQLDVVRRQQMTLFRQGSHSDVIHGMQCARPIKVFLYVWNVLIIILGLGLLCMGLYFLYYQENGRMVPPLAYNLATYTGLALAIVSILGLLGLQQQRRCTTEGKRNYVLGTVSFIHCPLVHTDPMRCLVYLVECGGCSDYHCGWSDCTHFTNDC